MSDTDPKKQKLFGLLSIPGWLAMLGASLHLLEDVEWIWNKLPVLANFLREIFPKGSNENDFVTFGLGTAWVICLLVVIPKLAPKIGPKRAVLVTIVPILLLAIAFGAWEGSKEISAQNRKYHDRQNSDTTNPR